MTAVVPGAVSPRAPSPPTSRGPEYVDRPAPARFTGSEVKDAETIERMRVAGRLAAQARELVGSHVAPGRHHRRARPDRPRVPLRPRRLPVDAGLQGLPQVAVHVASTRSSATASRTDRVVEDGDIVNIDITAYLDGVHGDTNATFLAGDVDEETRLLVERTREALERGIKAVAPGRRINVIGRVIESYAKRFGYGVVRDFTGHGIGTTFHSGLVIPHYDERSTTTSSRSG